ncbi:PilZ domain-containing protein [Tolumonas lignilytica]|jgi:PilZ domain.|uniref:PilZ domain-containing protein n=1 Tax=Tolumonas lignilytica TaxID=1283284 RepID=UPI000462F099|nr:PilZ domain-containing protein [Tolumonas lignilytica]
MLTTTRERRTFMRMVINAPVTLIRGSEHILATCRDLSANGMAIEVETDTQFTLEEILSVSLSTNSNALPPFVADAKIVRLETIDEIVQLGVEFVTVG